MTDQDENDFKKATECHICNKNIIKQIKKSEITVL